jgi:hypothetical protein
MTVPMCSHRIGVPQTKPVPPLASQLQQCVTAPGPLSLAMPIADQIIGIDLQIEISPSPYVNAEIFERYVDTVSIPAVEANRQLPRCDKKPAILFCDNCSAHMSNSVLEKLARHGILVLTYPPHTSRIFQVLDVLLFGLIKRFKNIKYVMIHCPYMLITF